MTMRPAHKDDVDSFWDRMRHLHGEEVVPPAAPTTEQHEQEKEEHGSRASRPD
jgi:hypothetical protein